MLQEEPLPEEPILAEEKPSASVKLCSSSSEDSAIMDSSSPVPDYFKSHQEFFRRMAAALGIQSEFVQENSHKLLDILQAAAPGRVAHPVHEALLEPAKTL